ncbi:c-type cytochrome [Falsiroseomonas bella]|nr:c-type cytochrome [Falsiroseomonas bella]
MTMAAALAWAAAGGAQAADAQRGRQLFAACQACHTVDGENGVGPTLKGVVGRRAGTVEDFRYSPAMRRSTVVWNAATLERFMADPQQVVRGNRMPFEGVADETDRADITAFLEQDAK